MVDLDPRLHAYRADLADILLEDKVLAYNYAEGKQGFCGANSTELRRKPKKNAPLDTVLIPFEEVKIFEISDGVAWVQSVMDGYVGYTDEANLIYSGSGGSKHRVPNYRVISLGTMVYPSPDIKSVRIGHLGFTTDVYAEESAHPNFMKIIFPLNSGVGYIYKSHLAPIEKVQNNPVSIARQFEYLPYLWGGRSINGIDCSGLVQLVYRACGINLPRDSDLQFQYFNESQKLSRSDISAGDLIFWRGHVAIATDHDNLIHANGYHMLVREEAIDPAIKRIQDEWGDIIGIVKNPFAH